jgi:hypothetical protein
MSANRTERDSADGAERQSVFGPSRHFRGRCGDLIKLLRFGGDRLHLFASLSNQTWRPLLADDSCELTSRLGIGAGVTEKSSACKASISLMRS